MKKLRKLLTMLLIWCIIIPIIFPVWASASTKVTAKKVSYKLKDTGNGVIAILTNKNSVPVSIEATLVYYNDSGKMIMSTSDNNYCLERKASCALFFNAPYDSNYSNVEYADYKITLKIEKANYSKYAAKKIKVKADMGSDNVTAEINNTSKYTLDSIRIAIVFYDSDNNAIGYSYTHASCEDSGSTDYITFDFPYDENYNTIYPESFKIYVNQAYKYF